MPNAPITGPPPMQPIPVQMPMPGPAMPNMPPGMQPVNPPMGVPGPGFPPGFQPAPTGPVANPNMPPMKGPYPPAMYSGPPNPMHPNAPFMPQPPMTAPPMQPQPLVDLQDHQKALLQQVVSLTQEQIDKLPPEQRQQVQQLRKTLLMSGYRYQ